MDRDVYPNIKFTKYGNATILGEMHELGVGLEYEITANEQITDLIYAGVPLKSVQYMMGHENIDMTLGIYADVRIDNNSIVKTLTDFWK